MKHTPGPWEVECVKTSIGRCFKVGKREFFAGGHGCICLYDDDTSINPLPHKEIEANAYLVASAPKLYKACKEALNYLNHPYTSKLGNVEIIDLLQRVIAKAEEK